MYVSSLKEISVGESVTEYLLGNASSGLHISLIAMLPKGEVIVITSVYLILDFPMLGILPVLWAVCSNLGAMKSKHLIFQRKGASPSPEALTVSELAD